MSESKNKDVLIEKLWRRMSERGDFPMLSNSLRATISAMKSDDYDFTALVQVVLSDFTLTQKVIRLANSAMYMAFGGNITTVSRALMVLGMEAVGHLVLGLKLVDHFHQSQSHTYQIDAKLELNRAMLAGCIARKVTEAGNVQTGEQAVVCTLMRQLGKLLCLFYLESEWQVVRERAEREDRSTDDLCLEILGVSFEELGEAAAKRWGLPSTIRAGMQPFDPDADPDSIPEEIRWLRAVTSFSTQVSEYMTVAGDDPQLCDEQIRTAASIYGDALAMDPVMLVGIADNLAQENVSKNFIKEIDELRGQASGIKVQDAERHIRDGLGDLRSLPSENLLAQVLTMASETVLASLRFSRTIVFVRDTRNGTFHARLGFGTDIEPLLPRLYFDAAFSADVFHLAIANSVGIFIENARDPKFSSHIPGWFRQVLPNAQAFVLLPVKTESGAVALLYGDWDHPDLVRKILPHEMSALNELARELGRFFKHASINAMEML
jgi:HD-like signal output (HDOD) protein